MREHPDILAAIQGGDARALERVVRECLPALLRTARAAGLSADRAEDAVQGSLLVFVQRAGEFDGRARACTWIHGILWRKIWEERRSVRREAEHEDVDRLVEGRFDAEGNWSRPPEGPAEALARGGFRRELEECLGRLPDRQRVAFTLREVEGFETAEICNILDVSANNLGVILFRARNGLRECLESKGFEGSRDAAVQ
ncbi:MAG: sigma-70 family RNA polymerase sigma factor [Longimicrobiales bacterium]